MRVRPVGDRLLVTRIEEQGPQMTPGGLHVPDIAGGTAVDLRCPRAWRGRVDDFEAEDPTITLPWLKVGRIVLFRPFAGVEVDAGLIIETSDVLAVEFK